MSAFASRGHAVAWFAFAVVALAIASARSESAPREFASYDGTAMATDWQVVLPARDGAGRDAEACLELFRSLDRELSEWRDGSPLAAVNRAAGIEPVAVPPELYALVERSIELGAATEGAFDVSWAALWGLWDFGAERPAPPADAAIAARLPLVDFRRVVADPERRTLFLPEPGMKLGLGAIGKGWALERAAALLEARGYRDFMLVGGGQVLARGARGDRPWRIGVRDPRGAPDDLFARVEISGASLATSADNESFFVVDGVRYHHVLDPRTGRPARGLRSATVLHADAATADALSTAVLVLGAERGLEVAARLGAEALVVDDRGAVTTTAGWRDALELLQPPRAAG